MTHSVEQRLAELGLSLPEALAPIAAYVPTVRTGNLLHISGQVSFRDGAIITGRLGDDMDVEAGAAAAQCCGLMLLAQIKAALGGFDTVSRIVKLGVFVTSAPEFIRQPEVANGASELMVHVFGDAGRHSRSAVGVPALPRGAAVEIDAIVEIAG